MNNYYKKYIKYKSKYLELKSYSVDSLSKTKQSTFNINDAYQTKYIKYKTKYIKEKGQTGGVGKPCNDAKKISDITIATILSEYDCDYQQILNNFEKLLNKFNYNEFNEINKITIRNFLKKKKITIRNLLDKQFPIDFLLKRNFPAPELKEAGVSVEDYIKENIFIYTILQHFTLDELSNHYAFIKCKLLDQMIWRHFVLLDDLKKLKINISIEDFKNKLKFSIKDLRDAGFTIGNFKDNGFSEKDLKQAGFTALDMQRSGYTVKSLIELGYTVTELLRAIFSKEQLKKAGITLHDFIKDGIELSRILQYFDICELSIEPYRTQIEKMLKERLENHLKSKILRFRVGINLSINDLSNTFNFTNTDLIKAGFDTTEFKNAKIPLNIGDLLDLGFNAERFKKEEIAIKDIVEFVMNHKKEVNLKKLGYTLDDLYSVHIIERSILKDFGFDSVSISNFRDELLKKISEQKKTTQQNLKILGYNALVLKKLLYNSSQLKAEGFSAMDLKQAGFIPFELKHAGFIVLELKDVGYTVAEFKKSFYTAKELKDARFSAKELKDADFTAFELKQAGFTAIELKDAGFTVELKQAGFTAFELKDAGFSADNLKEAGFSADGLVIAGFNIEEIIGVGFNRKDITIEDDVICTITPKMNYDVDNLKKKFSVTQLKGFGISLKQFIDAKFGIKKLAAEFKIEELKPFYTAQQLKTANFSANELKDQGFSITELKQGGFNNQQLKDAGFKFNEFMKIGVIEDDFNRLA